MKKNNQTFYSWLGMIVLAVFASMNSGCASFAGHELPEVTPSQYPGIQAKPSIYLDVMFITDINQPVENREGTAQLKNLVGQLTDESGLFSHYTTDKTRADEMDYRIQLDVVNFGNQTAAMLAGIISGVTLGIIPTWVKDHYRLEGMVFDSKGNELRLYTYKDHVTTWFHLIFIPMTKSTKEIPWKVITNMIRNFYLDLAREPFFSQPARHGPSKKKQAPRETTEPRRIPLSEVTKIEVTAEHAVLYLNPDIHSAEITTIPAGTVLKGIEIAGDWYRVALPPDENGYVIEGYIHKSQVKRT
jgi:hypothetical protein